jgi:CRISPR-associated protein (TIGR03986 family)
MTWESGEKRFVNPYNFVSIGEAVRREKYKTGNLSGSINCRLKTLTPVIIPETPKAPEKPKVPDIPEHNEYDFFTVRGKAIIPGSSLRGVIRTAYEAVTNSCLSTADDENVLYRRTAKPKNKYGIIERREDGSYLLHPAKKIMLNSKCGHAFGKDHRVTARNLKTGQIVWVTFVKGTYRTSRNVTTELRGVNDLITTAPIPGGESRGEYHKGVVLLGEEFGRKKHHDAVFVFTEGKKDSVSPEEYQRLCKVWELYQPRKNDDNPGRPKGVNQTVNAREAYKNYLQKDNQFIPVYYNEVADTAGKNPVRYMSPACITKEVFRHTIKSLLKAQGQHNPCNHEDYGDAFCPACALFGIVQTKDAIASRVMVCDAILPGKNKKDKVTLPILGSPKVSATEFYMSPVAGADYWNYDYSVTGNRASLIKEPRLRGRKFYWHSIPGKEPKKENEKTKFNATFTPAEGECNFEVAFDRLAEDELQKLVWTLSFGRFWNQAGSENYAHKLGHGKPVGYGSVKIDVSRIVVYSLNEDAVIQAEDNYQLKEWAPEQTTAVQEFLKMHNWTDRPRVSVSYPVGISNRGTGVYQWFVGYKKGGGINPEFNKKVKIPGPLEKDVSLPWLIEGYGR